MSDLGRSASIAFGANSQLPETCTFAPGEAAKRTGRLFAFCGVLALAHARPKPLRMIRARIRDRVADLGARFLLREPRPHRLQRRDGRDVRLVVHGAGAALLPAGKAGRATRACVLGSGLGLAGWASVTGNCDAVYGDTPYRFAEKPSLCPFRELCTSVNVLPHVPVVLVILLRIPTDLEVPVPEAFSGEGYCAMGLRDVHCRVYSVR